MELGEGLLVVTQTPLKIPIRKFKTYQGSTAGDMIGPVVMPRDQWEMTVAEKKTLYWTDGFVCIPGNLPPNLAALASDEERKDTSKEPVFFHSYPINFYTELIQAFPVHAIID